MTPGRGWRGQANEMKDTMEDASDVRAKRGAGGKRCGMSS